MTLLTLSICNAMYVYHWNDDAKSARKLLALLKTELLDFEGAYERYKLSEHGVTKQMWLDCLHSEAPDSNDNVVRRAALRVAARHLRPPRLHQGIHAPGPGDHDQRGAPVVDRDLPREPELREYPLLRPGRGLSGRGLFSRSRN